MARKHLAAKCSDPEVLVKDLNEALTLGNHKEATAKPELLHILIHNDVKHGYYHHFMSNFGAFKHHGTALNRQNGQIIEKDRLTHNQSFAWSFSGTLVNSRVKGSQLLPCMFGWCLCQITNWAVAARQKYPKRPILATKVDYKSASPATINDEQ